MNRHRLIISVIFALVTGWQATASAQWLAGGPAGYGGAPAMGGRLAMGSNACDTIYSDFAGPPSSTIGGQRAPMSGLASGCKPVGKVRQRLGLGAHHGYEGYNVNAYAGGLGPEYLANPYGQHPGFGPNNEFMNQGDVCCGPHWYDVMVQGVFLARTKDADRGLMSVGPRGLGQPNLVLSTGDLGTDLDFGMRVHGRIQLNAVQSLEVAYLGGIDFNDTQRAVSQFDDLYSIYSDFGVNPLGGFEDTDQAIEATATIHSELDSGGINLRKDWVSKNNKSSGSLLFGARYIGISDTFRFSTNVRDHIDDVTAPASPIDFGPGSSVYTTETSNDLYGLQIGLEFVRCIVPGLTIGVDSKAGAYANDASQSTGVSATSGSFNVSEYVSDTDFAYSADAQAFILWQIHPLAKLRGGYEVLFVDRVATGYTNFRPEDVFTAVPRNPGLDQSDNLLFHGFHFGLELGW